MQDFAVPRDGSRRPGEATALNPSRWPIPRPSRPTAPAWTAVLRETRGCEPWCALSIRISPCGCPGLKRSEYTRSVRSNLGSSNRNLEANRDRPSFFPLRTLVPHAPLYPTPERFGAYSDLSPPHEGPMTSCLRPPHRGSSEYEVGIRSDQLFRRETRRCKSAGRR